MSTAPRSARWHRYLGLVLLVPLLGWSATGLVFYFKPGYAAAYEQLEIRYYPLAERPRAPVDTAGSWLEWRRLRSVLGEHLLVRDEQGWQQLDPLQLMPRAQPGREQLRLLLDDAVSMRRERYGRVVAVNGLTAVTDTGVELTLDWQRMSLRQRGGDTRLIGALYDIHYLRLTGIEALDRALALLAIALLLFSTVLGGYLFFRKPRQDA